MSDTQDFTSADTLIGLLTRAQHLAERRVLDEPLDVPAADVALGIALLRGQASKLAGGLVPLTPSELRLGLVESLEHAEALTRDVQFVGVIQGHPSDFVVALCDLIREARSLV